jgi:hypothetical protein
MVATGATRHCYWVFGLGTGYRSERKGGGFTLTQIERGISGVPAGATKLHAILVAQGLQNVIKRKNLKFILVFR